MMIILDGGVSKKRRTSTHPYKLILEALSIFLTIYDMRVRLGTKGKFSKPGVRPMVL